MKKLALSLAIVLGMSFGAMAQGGLFQYGDVNEGYETNRGFGLREGGIPGMPGDGHGAGTDQGATTPLAGGALLLIGFGAAYALKKRNEK